ncbi:bifunctional alpha,alpha-trehalose-phosphate synthase (UDP-forming)/trehalose-phosphatase [Rapidithrix thailandica]|uniref:Alpha,alpha-trehalose-phosphate synthase n=1 Tax=Rapidithrix thailandica TaxID=413964 RepID=A0AAW9RXA9_9BACT
MPEKKIIIVSNRLPVTIQREDGNLTFKPSAGGLATGLSSVYRQGNNLWIGWPGLYSQQEAEKDLITQNLRNDHMAPVFLTEEDVHEFYEGFSNKTLWPLFHYFTEYAQYQQVLWEAYERVNRKFCAQVLQYAGPDDVIWVHDYQLLLLPSMIREKLPNATIGFFQHIPFPSFEIFRLLPWRKQILEGMLGSDLIGFHTYDDMRHFLSSVSRILGHNNTMGLVKKENRLIQVDSFPMGIDYEKFARGTKDPQTIEKYKRYEKLLSDQKVIISIDRLDYSKGIKQRLKAMDIFFTRYPEYIGKVSLVLIVVPSRVKVDQYQALKEEIDTMVGWLNGKYSRMDWTPIHYFYRSFSFHGLSALYSSAEVALITPLRDGMNLVCKEFIASKLDKKGVLILSEMAGSAKELSEAILVNPNDIQQIVDAMYQALTMPEEEQIARNEEMQNKLKRYNIHRWVEMFMEQLEIVKQKQTELELRFIHKNNHQKLLDRYSAGKKRILFLDYDGTLRSFVKRPEDAKPDAELYQLLEQLASNPKNRVVIISGRDRHTLENWLGHLPVDLIAEHGVWLRGQGQEWHLIENLHQEWKEKIRHILEQYVDRTPGSFIEDKDYSLVWHYRKADVEFGALRSRELLSNMNYLIGNMNLQTMEGNKVIEIKNRDVNKGKAARKWLGETAWDFVMAIGDDVTDEDTFIEMPEGAYTIKVGFTSSNAKYNIKSTQEVRHLLKAMAEQS